MSNTLDSCIGATPGRRGCGDGRDAGSAYFETGLSEWGTPLRAFLIDPPHRTAGLGAVTIGTSWLPALRADGSTVWHILDVVGKEGYPSPADFYEEVKRMGLSRKLSPLLDFSRLTPDSQIFLAHDKALVRNYLAYTRVMQEHERDLPACPVPHPFHPHPGKPGTLSNEPCVGCWWELIDAPRIGPDGLVRVADTVYPAHPTPPDFRPEYEQAMFLHLPLTRLVVVKGNNHEKTLAKVRAARVRIDEVEE